MRILITGMAGFVGRHLAQYLIKTHHQINNHDNNSAPPEGISRKIEITGVDIREDINYGDFCRSALNAGGSEEDAIVNFARADLRKKHDVEKIIKDLAPDRIYHLAAQSSVSYSWENPRQTFEINVFSGINILESVKKHSPGCRVLFTCTAEEYDIADNMAPGNTGAGIKSDCGQAITEQSKINPSNPYAISKAAIDFFATTYCRATGIAVYVTRSFNHTGPGQSERFVVSDFAKQVAEIEAGIKAPVINVGNTEVYRDFLDVRDVVRAYRDIIEKGHAGQIYNVCSGERISVSQILGMLMSLSSIKNIKVKVDSKKIRPIDSYSVYGDNTKLKDHTGWEPCINIIKSLEDTLNWWRKEIKK
ncbi:MAG: NAD-dependent epimerase/dehydratase family protein [Actinobacteria bacterium]|nr:NAD-dependent epimerase/dehydratase family protein [Actinomycetota bacterium]